MVRKPRLSSRYERIRIEHLCYPSERGHASPSHVTRFGDATQGVPYDGIPSAWGTLRYRGSAKRVAVGGTFYAIRAEMATDVLCLDCLVVDCLCLHYDCLKVRLATGLLLRGSGSSLFSILQILLLIILV